MCESNCKLSDTGRLMGRSRKKWHLKEDNEKFFLSHGDGLMKLPNSSKFLGHVVELIEPTKRKSAQRLASGETY